LSQTQLGALLAEGMAVWLPHLGDAAVLRRLLDALLEQSVRPGPRMCAFETLGEF
jgi:hypothetical protein